MRNLIIHDVTFGGYGCCLICIVINGIAVFKLPLALRKTIIIVQYSEIHHNYRPSSGLNKTRIDRVSL